MSIAVRKDIPTHLELQYEELKKQALVDRNADQTRNSRKELQSDSVNDQVTLSTKAGDEEPTGRKPSQPVTLEEMQALRRSFSVYA